MLHQPEDLIVDRYRIIDFLGEGLGGSTYRAIDLKNDRYVVLKVLSWRQMKSWKIMELFEREACVLAQLEHPAIPDYLNYFQVDSFQEKYWYLIQKLDLVFYLVIPMMNYMIHVR